MFEHRVRASLHHDAFMTLMDIRGVGVVVPFLEDALDDHVAGWVAAAVHEEEAAVLLVDGFLRG